MEIAPSELLKTQICLPTRFQLFIASPVTIQAALRRAEMHMLLASHALAQLRVPFITLLLGTTYETTGAAAVALMSERHTLQ